MNIGRSMRTSATSTTVPLGLIIRTLSPILHSIIVRTGVHLAHILRSPRFALHVRASTIHAVPEGRVAFIVGLREVGEGAGAEADVVLVAAGGQRLQVGRKHLESLDLPLCRPAPVESCWGAVGNHLFVLIARRFNFYEQVVAWIAAGLAQAMLGG